MPQESHLDGAKTRSRCDLDAMHHQDRAEPNRGTVRFNLFFCQLLSMAGRQLPARDLSIGGTAQDASLMSMRAMDEAVTSELVKRACDELVMKRCDSDRFR